MLRAFYQLAGITRTLLPVMEKNGIATAAEVDVDTLAERLQRAVQTADATVVAPLFVGAWAQNPRSGRNWAKPQAHERCCSEACEPHAGASFARFAPAGSSRLRRRAHSR